MRQLGLSVSPEWSSLIAREGSPGEPKTTKQTHQATLRAMSHSNQI